MRLWHFKLLPYLPDKQFVDQLNDLLRVMRSWRIRGTVNNILVNRVMDYPKEELYDYFCYYESMSKARGIELNPDIHREFFRFAFGDVERVVRCINEGQVFYGWHDEEYLRICMSVLYEKHINTGRSSITDSEWDKLLDGYKEITGEEYHL